MNNTLFMDARDEVFGGARDVDLEIDASRRAVDAFEQPLHSLLAGLDRSVDRSPPLLTTPALTTAASGRRCRSLAFELREIVGGVLFEERDLIEDRLGIAARRG